MGFFNFNFWLRVWPHATASSVVLRTADESGPNRFPANVYVIGGQVHDINILDHGRPRPNDLTGRAQNFLPRLLLSENAPPVKF